MVKQKVLLRIYVCRKPSISNLSYIYTTLHYQNHYKMVTDEEIRHWPKLAVSLRTLKIR